MELRPLAAFAVLAIHLFLTGVAIQRSPTERSHRTFALLTLVVALWATGRVVGLDSATFGSGLTFAATVLTPLAFALLAPGRPRGAWLAGAAAAVLLVVRFTAPIPPARWTVLDPGRELLLVIFVAVPLVSRGVRLARRRRAGATLTVAERQVVAAAAVLGLGVVVVAIGSRMGLQRARADIFATLALEAAILVAIRARDPDIEPSVGTGLVTVVQSLATAAIVLVALSVANRMLGVTVEPLQVTLLVGSAFAAAWVIRVSRTRLERWVEEALYPERLRYRELAEEIAREREDLRRRMAHAEKLALIGEVAGSVAHEIKNPLGPIKGFAQMTLEDLDRPGDGVDREVLRRRLTVMVEEVERIDERVRGLLEHVREDDEERTACDLNQVVARAALLVEGEAGRRPGIRLEPELCQGALPVPHLQRRAFEGALINLLLNALEAIGDRGTVRVRTGRAPSNGAAGGVWVVVEDDGCGIGPDRLPHVFDAFESGRQGGVGLGLGIARRTVEAAGGTIDIESEVGEGTRVRITLPDVRAAGRPGEPAPGGSS